jgi:hypothetical protein
VGQSKTNETVGFLRDLFGDAPGGDDLRIALWTKSNKRTDHLDGAVDGARFEGRPDVYVQATLVGPDAPKGGKRPKAEHAAATPGVWADIDVAGGPEDPPGKLLAPDVDAALEIANGILTPTIIVHSGYGVQAWWLLEEPWRFENDEERSQAGRMTKGWQRLLRNAALDKAFGIDYTFDLARLMRLPGTVNDKGPAGVQAAVRVLEDDGPRYSMEEIAGYAMDAAPLQEATQTAKLTSERRFNVQKFEALKENNETFRATWEHTRRERETRGWSMSEFDLALASMAVNAGWSDDEVAELITEHRRKHNGGDDQKATRVDYLSRTITRARQNAKASERQEHQDAAIDELAQQAESPNGTIDPGRTMALFNEIISGGREGAPRMMELVQYGKDPDDARFVFVLADGREINVGPYANLRQTRRLDERIGPATGFVMNRVKEDNRWISALTALLRVAQIREEGEDKTREWVKRYTDDRLGATREEAAREGEPFEEETWIYVKVAPLARYVRGVMRERINHADLIPLLRRAGFEQHTVHYDTKEGRRSTGSYWRIAKDELS